MERALIKFHAGIKSVYTQKLYDKYLGYFLRFVKIKNADGLLQLKDNHLQDLVEDYVIHLKDKGLRKSSVDGRIGAIELFLSMNDRVLNFKKIRKMSPQKLKSLGGRAWTDDEIRKMLSYTTSKRNHAIIHLLSSTGCRIGAVSGLKLKHIAQIENCKSILFYENSTEEYYGYLTPEASIILDEYLEERRKAGEWLKPESPLFREKYIIGMAKAETLSYEALRSVLREIVRKMRGVGDGKRTEVAMFNGFRKRFDTKLKNNREINISLAEKMMGHFNRLVPLDTFYHKPDREMIFTEFKKAIRDLTIDESEKERVGRIEAEQKVEKLEGEKDEVIARQSQEISDLKKSVAAIYDLIGKD